MFSAVFQWPMRNELARERLDQTIWSSSRQRFLQIGVR
jgi:hypothetical protein